MVVASGRGKSAQGPRFGDLRQGKTEQRRTHMYEMDDLPPRHLRGHVVCEICGYSRPAGWEEAAVTEVTPATLPNLLREHFHATGHVVTVVLEKEVPNEMPVGDTINRLRAALIVELALVRD